MTDIEAQVVARLRAVTGIQAVYDYPVREIGRSLPAAAVVYSDVAQEWATKGGTRTIWAWEIAVYWPAEGRTLQAHWGQMKAKVAEILRAFRADPTLGGTVYGSIIRRGQPVVVIPPDEAAGPQYIGHTFRLEAWREEV